MGPGTGTEFRAFALTQIRCAQRVRCTDVGGWNVENRSASATAPVASGLLMAGRIGTNAAADGAGSALGERI